MNKPLKSFSPEERAILLAVKGVGPTVVARFEQMGITSLAVLARGDVETICSHGAAMTGSTCWKNSPIARKAVGAAIEAARQNSKSKV